MSAWVITVWDDQVGLYPKPLGLDPVHDRAIMELIYSVMKYVHRQNFAVLFMGQLHLRFPPTKKKKKMYLTVI